MKMKLKRENVLKASQWFVNYNIGQQRKHVSFKSISTELRHFFAKTVNESYEHLLISYKPSNVKNIPK